MSEYAELIKKFDKVRDYMRDFYIYGFKPREAFREKSGRSYDNERRRIESFLDEYITSRQDDKGKNIIIQIDSTEIVDNPFYRAFKAKSFTKNDITLHFYILDILADRARTAPEIWNSLPDYAECFSGSFDIDIATVRNKLKEYEKAGLLSAEKSGRTLLYSLVKNDINLSDFTDALAFFSQVSPLGVIGSFIMDQIDGVHSLNIPIIYKHNYIVHALESEILEILLRAIDKKSFVEIVNASRRSEKSQKITVIPMFILVSLQGGRRYLSTYSVKSKSFKNYRLDYIQSVKILDECTDFPAYYKNAERLANLSWGASLSGGFEGKWLSMQIEILPGEEYVLERVKKEGRHGKVIKIDDYTYEYSIEVLDPKEMFPWLRTFIGRIVSLKCQDNRVVELFWEDFDSMAMHYSEVKAQ